MCKLLSNDRGYYLPDKGERGRVVYDPHNLALPLAAWCTQYTGATRP